jgi:hypothetical protein
MRHLSFVAAPLVWLLTTGALFAQADPLGIVPHDALGFAVIKNIADTAARVEKLTQKMQIPAPNLLTIAKAYAGLEKGLDEKGGIAAAILADPDDEDRGYSYVIVVPVTDYKVFIEQLDPDDIDDKTTEVTIAGESYLVAKKGNFALIGDPEKPAVLESVLASTQAITASVEPLRAWMAGQQLAVVVTPKGKATLFKKILELFPEPAALKTEEKDDDPAAADLKTAAELLTLAKRLLASAEEQLTFMTLGVRIDDDTSLHVAARLLFAPDGKLAAWAKEVKLPKQGLLAGLPPGKFAVAYGGVSAQFSPEIASLIDRFTDIGLRRLGLSEQTRKTFAEATKRQQANKSFTSGLLGLIRPGDSLLASAVSVEHVKNAAVYLKMSREILEIVQAGLENKTTDEPLYELNDITVGDLKVLEVVTNTSLLMGMNDAQQALAGPMQAMFAKLFGKEGKMRLYSTAADDHTVVSAYTKEQLQRAVAHVRAAAQGLEVNPEIAKTMALLPAGAQWAAYVSPQGLLQWVDALLRDILPPESNFKIPSFPATEPIGLAARVSESGLDAEIVLPENVVAGIGQFVGTVQQMFQGGGLPLP